MFLFRHHHSHRHTHRTHDVFCLPRRNYQTTKERTKDTIAISSKQFDSCHHFLFVCFSNPEFWFEFFFFEDFPIGHRSTIDHYYPHVQARVFFHFQNFWHFYLIFFLFFFCRFYPFFISIFVCVCKYISNRCKYIYHLWSRRRNIFVDKLSKNLKKLNFFAGVCVVNLCFCFSNFHFLCLSVCLFVWLRIESIFFKSFESNDDHISVKFITIRWW